MRAQDSKSAQQPQYILIALPEKRERRSSKNLSRFTKTFRRAVLALILTILAFTSGGLGATPSSPSNAVFDLPDFCGYTDPFTMPFPIPWPGVSLLAEAVVPSNLADAAISLDRFEKFTQPYGNKSVTAEEWYGTAGMSWQSTNYANIDGTCIAGLMRTAIGSISSLWWTLVVLIGSVGLSVFNFATSISAFDFFIDTLGDVVEKLNAALYTQYLVPIVMLGALWMGWQGLVRRRSSEAFQGALWMIGATSAAAIFFAQPADIAKYTNNIVTTVQDVLIETVASAGAGSVADGGGPCSIDDGGAPDLGDNPTDEEIDAASERSTRVTKCALWYTFLFTPWAEGQFGAAAGKLTVEKYYPREGGDPVFFGEGAPMPAIGAGGKAKELSDFAESGQSGIPVEWLQLDTWSFNHDQVLSGDLESIVTKTNQWYGITQRFAKSENGEGAQANLYDWQPEDTWINPPGTAQWSNADFMHRFLIAILALVAMIAGAGPIMFISLIMVIQEIGFIFLVFFTPIFLLLGVHPGAGRRIAMNWLEQILSLSLKRIGNALVFGVLLTMIAAIVGSDAGSWFIQVLLVICVSAAALIFRKRIVDGISQVNLGGAGADFGGEATSAARGMAGKTVGSAANTATNLAGGQGGGLVGTLVGGAIAGAGGASLLSAGRRKGDSQRIGDNKPSKEQNKYNKWFEDSVVGKAEMDEYQARDESKLRQREEFAMDKFSGNPEEIRQWQEWAAKHGQKLRDGSFMPRAIPRPADPVLAQTLRDAGLTLREDVEEAADKILEGARENARVTADGVRVLPPVDRPLNPIMEERLKSGGVTFSDDLQKSVQQWKTWAVTGPGGEGSPRAIPAYATKDQPFFKEALQAEGINNFEDDRGAPKHAAEYDEWNDAGAGHGPQTGGRHAKKVPTKPPGFDNSNA